MSDVSVRAAPPLSSRSQALLQVAESIAHHRDLAELFHDLAARLHDVAHFDYLNLVLHDPERQVMRLHLLEALREKPTHVRVGLEFPIGSAPSGRVLETQQAFVVSDVERAAPARNDWLRKA
jgi:formate hydrogenlyase transcriptional activator